MALHSLNSIELKLGEACGPVVAAEVRMRIIAELSEEVRDKLTELVDDNHQERLKDNPKAKRESDEYNDCKLSFLDKAIDFVFQKELSGAERQKLIEFREPRNKLMHGDFVGLMKKLKIKPTGRQILSVAGDRNELTSKDIKESLISINHNRGLETIRSQANDVIGILNKILQSLA